MKGEGKILLSCALISRLRRQLPARGRLSYKFSGHSLRF